MPRNEAFPGLDLADKQNKEHDSKKDIRRTLQS